MYSDRLEPDRAIWWRVQCLASESSSLPSVARLADGRAVCSRLIRGVSPRAMDRRTNIAASLLTLLTGAYAMVYWEVVTFRGALEFLIVSFWTTVLLSGVLLLRVRKAPVVVVPVVVAAGFVVAESARSVVAWTLWSINGFAP